MASEPIITPMAYWNISLRNWKQFWFVSGEIQIYKFLPFGFPKTVIHMLSVIYSMFLIHFKGAYPQRESWLDKMSKNFTWNLLKHWHCVGSKCLHVLKCLNVVCLHEFSHFLFLYPQRKGGLLLAKIYSRSVLSVQHMHMSWYSFKHTLKILKMFEKFSLPPLNQWNTELTLFWWHTARTVCLEVVLWFVPNGVDYSGSYV